MAICNKCIDLYSNTSDIYRLIFTPWFFFCPFTDAAYFTLQFSVFDSSIMKRQIWQCTVLNLRTRSEHFHVFISICICTCMFKMFVKQLLWNPKMSWETTQIILIGQKWDNRHTTHEITCMCFFCVAFTIQSEKWCTV